MNTTELYKNLGDYSPLVSALCFTLITYFGTFVNIYYQDKITKEILIFLLVKTILFMTYCFVIFKLCNKHKGWAWIVFLIPILLLLIISLVVYVYIQKISREIESELIDKKEDDQ
jgi:predicted neutral ceramidase superfamily lipid hydrolase